MGLLLSEMRQGFFGATVPCAGPRLVNKGLLRALTRPNSLILKALTLMLINFPNSPDNSNIIALLSLKSWGLPGAPLTLT